jgi:outer membrane receptor for ferrienterochelin and colicin
MFAADPPAIIQAGQEQSQPDVIEIVGNRPDQVQKIDRRTYTVRDNPHAAQKDAIELVRNLPSVTVTPDDDIALLGNGSVRIFVDGRPYLGNSRDYLRRLHGSDIERIEIITNPSAQYSAEGTGGIINFILRKKQGEGTSGIVSSDLSSLGEESAVGSVKYKRGRWTYEASAREGFGNSGRSSYRRLRTVGQADTSAASTNSEEGSNRAHQLSGSASAKLGYQLDPKTAIALQVSGDGGHEIRQLNAAFTGLTPGFESFSEVQRTNDEARFLSADATFDHRGSKEGETLDASLQLFVAPGVHSRSITHLSNSASLSVLQDNRQLVGHGKLDWQHPLAKRRILSLGADWNYFSGHQRYAFSSTGSGGPLGRDTADRYDAASSTLAAYATFQQPVGSWTLMPGARIEYNSREIVTPGSPNFVTHRTYVFPTFHGQHRFGNAVDLTLSFSKRIRRAQGAMLRPFSTVENVLTIVRGNPDLKDETTNSYEADIHYRRKKVDLLVTLYHRETSGLWSTQYTVSNGVSIYTWINSGRSRDRGAEVDIGLPIVRRVKAHGSIDLFDENAPVDTTAGTKNIDRFRFTSKASLEWDGKDRGKIPGDVVQLEWQYLSPSRSFESRYYGTDWFSFAYTHNFTGTFSFTGSAAYSAPIRSRLLAPLVQELNSARRPVELKLKLMKTFTTH